MNSLARTNLIDENSVGTMYNKQEGYITNSPLLNENHYCFGSLCRGLATLKLDKYSVQFGDKDLPCDIFEDKCKEICKELDCNYEDTKTVLKMQQNCIFLQKKTRNGNIFV
ncbi:hypothetical protein NQ318_020249 [Aromia moschata]|uniref:Uncharacterized protein n=1 Tax=Aromia moschata TaxID=1265417 RepID=A0AAV8Z9V0_9CUCU|nr:hypothetical protein NQ318_020249 [Aromia moschata]